MTRLRVPGPTPVPERVRAALAGQVLYHRSDEFCQRLNATTGLLAPLFGVEDPPLLLTSSGTGALEAALINALAPGDKVLAMDNGHWGARLGRLAETLGAEVQLVTSPWGTGADVEGLKTALSGPESKHIRAVLVAHNDTFTGAVSDLAAIGAVVRNHPALLIVDAVSSLGTMPIMADEWGLDIVVAASQKGLMCPPGLAMLSVSEKAWRRIQAHPPCSEYWNLSRARKMAAKGQTQFTPAVNSIAALHEALTMIHELGMEATFARHRLLSEALKQGVNALGLSIFSAGAVNSPAVSVISLPQIVSGGDLVNHLRRRYDTIVAGARRSQLDGRVIRLGTMGYCAADDIRLDLWQLAYALGDLGHPCDVPTVSEACESVLQKDIH